MLRIDEALEQVLAEAKRLPAEAVPLLDAMGRFLAEDVFADIDLPSFDNSAVDGYAVCHGDTRGASAANPVILREVGDIPAGGLPACAITPGAACRIMTGAPLPPGADAVVMI
ncbi:MAG TPA: hypothetical protein VKT77_08735, partial [Chthonomonadaceae bacterium]|nr:hypothetical protein [Chthonomonadaceae bacterium]